MSFTTADLVKVEHPGDADIWHGFDVSFINGEEAISNSQLYWEDADGNLVRLKAGDGQGLPFEGRIEYRYDCFTPYEFTSAWLQSDGKLRTFGNQATNADCNKGYGDEAELILDPEKGYKVRTVEHKGGVKGNAGGGTSYWIAQADDDLFYYEKLYDLDINTDGFVGYIAPKLRPLIVDQGIYEKPAAPILLDSDFGETYKGTSQNDEVSWNDEFTTTNLLIQTIEGDDVISSVAAIDEIAADGGSGNDDLSIQVYRYATAIGGSGDDSISLYPASSDYLSAAIHSGSGDDTLQVRLDSVKVLAGTGDDTVISNSPRTNSDDILIWLEEGADQYIESGDYTDYEISDLEVDRARLVLFGGDGNDQIFGGAGIRYSNGTQTVDTVFRANGLLFGDEGDDQLTGFYVNGGDGNDTLNGSIVELSSGNDTIEGFKYHQGDSIVVNSDLFGKTLAFNNDGNDLRITSDSGINSLLINPFEDLPIDFEGLKKSIYYLDGPGDLSGGENPGGDVGGSPDPDTEVAYELPETTSTVEGTNGKDKLRGKKSNDSILGLSGNDKLNGKKGDDILEGGDGNDTLKGSKGDDYLVGSQGVDVLTGGKGADVFKTSKGGDVVNDFNLNQGDRVGLNQGTEYEVIDDVDGTLIRVSDDIRMLLLDQDYDEFLAAGNDAIARIAV